MAVDELAHGRIVVELDDRATRELELLDNKFERTMRDIDRQDATVDLDADVDGLKRDLDRAKAEVKRYEKFVEDSETKHQRFYRKGALERARAAEAEAAKKLSAQQKVLESYKAEGEALKRNDARREAVMRHALQREKILAGAQRRKLATLREEERLNDRIARQNARELKDSERAAAARQRELNALPRLQREYVVLADKIQKLGDARRHAMRSGDEMAVLKVDVDEQAAIHRFNQIGRTLEREGIAIDIPVRPDVGHDFGLALRRRLAGNTTTFTMATAIGAEIGDRMGIGFRRRWDFVAQRGIGSSLAHLGSRAMTGLAGGLAAGMGKIGSILGNLSEMTVRIGPFTATIRQMLLALSVLGPIIVATIGALGALAGAAAGAAVGFGALSVGLLGGMIPAFAGVFMAVKPVAAQFSEAMKASKAYRQEVLQSGKNSEEAKEKLKALNDVLGNVDKRTRENFKAAGTLGERWKEITAPSRAAAFKLIGEGIRFASDNVKWFGERTNTATKNLSTGFTRMLRGLDTNAFKGMFDNFNQSIKPAVAGISNLLNYLARVGKVASGFLPNMAKGFRDWSKGILDTTNNADKFRDKVRKVVNVARDMGDFFMSFGRLMKEVFAGGMEEGQSFIKTMTRAMDRWTEFLATDKGQASLEEFFSNSVDGVQALFHSLAPLISMFTRWATVMEPVSSAFFHGVGYILDFVGAIMKFGPLRNVVTALATTLGTLWAIGKISAAVGAVRNFTAALLGLAGAQRAVAASQALAGGGGLAGALLGRGAPVAGMAADIALMGRQADETAAKSRTLGSSLMTIGRAAGPLGLTAIAVGGIFTAYKLFGNKTETVADQVNRLTQESLNYSEQAHKGITSSTGLYQELSAATSRQHTATKSVAEAQAEVDRLTKAGKTNTEAFRQALLELNAALRERKDATQAANKAAEAIQKADNMLAQSADAVRTASEGQNKAMDDIRATLERTGSAWDASMFGGKRPEDINARDLVKYREEFDSLIDTLKADPNLAGIGRALEENLDAARGAMAALTRARGEDSRAARQQAVHAVNLKRSLQEFQPLGRAAGEAMQQLTRSIGTKKTFEIAVKFPNPRQALNVMKAINSAIDQGVNKKRAINIALNSKTAEQALRRLDNLTIDDKDFRVVERGGREAVRLIEDILGKKLPPKTQEIVEKGGPRVVAMLQAIKDSRMPGKTQDIDERGGSLVLRILGVLRGFDIGKAIKTITDGGTGGTVSSILAGIRAIKDLGTATKHVRVEGAAAIAGIGGASGGYYTAAGGISPTVSKRQLELATASDLPVIGAGTVARGSKVRKPTLLVGEENRGEYVIATNPKYRKSNIEYLRMAARELGVEMAAGGLSKKQRRRRKKHSGAGNPENLKAVQNYYNLQGREEDANREISIAERKVRQPDSFIMEAGENDWGEMTYKVNQTAVDTYKQQLQDVSDKYALLTDPKTGIVAQMMEAAKKAYTALTSYRRRRRDNITFWQEIYGHFQKIAGKDLPDRKEGEKKKAYAERKENARKRKEHAQGQMRNARDKMRDQRDGIAESNVVEEDIREDEKDLGYRKQEYQIAHDDVKEERDSVEGRATDENRNAAPIAPDLPTDAESDISRLEAEASLREAGIGDRTKEAITTDLKAAWKARIDEAKAMLTDKNIYNDEEAYGILSSAGSALASLNDAAGGGGGGTDQSPAQQMYTLSNARADMFRQFGSNFSAASAFQLGSKIGSGYPYGQPAYPFAGATPSGGGSITINNSFPTPPPDPHIWSQGIAYELGTL